MQSFFSRVSDFFESTVITNDIQFSVRPVCGETIKQNLTYLIQTPTQRPDPKYCSYTICPISSDVNRIRLQFVVITH